MVTVQHSGLHEKLTLGIQKAQTSSRAVLVSQSMQISPIDPITFFSIGKDFTGTRTYFAEPEENLVLVGLGSAYTIEHENNNQYRDIEREWSSLKEESIVDPNSLKSGNGPILIGGFSFDPLKEKTKLWESFPDTKFVLPKFLLTKKNDETWLTINVIVDSSDNADAKADDLLYQQKTILNASNDINDYQEFEEIEEIDKEQWLKTVDKVAKEIRDHQIEKVVLARELKIKGKEQFVPGFILNRLRREQPTSYIFAIESGQDCFLGASPERLIKKESNQFLSTCLAGSIGRGKTASDDDKLGELLLNDNKNLHEHAVVVHMIREAMMSACEQVNAPEQPSLYKVRDIQHLYTPVVGRAKKDAGLLSLVQKLHPTPALGGFPQESALKKIREVELLDRGWYAAPIGWLNFNGDGEFIVAIRSGLIQGEFASLFAGCGIVGDSVSESEYIETKMKFRPMLSALGGTGNE